MSIICESQLDQVTHVLNLIISAFSPTLIFFFKIAGLRSERIRSLEHLLYLSCFNQTVQLLKMQKKKCHQKNGHYKNKGRQKMEYYRIISLKYSSNNVEQTSLVRCRGSFVRLP